jgi:aerobic carbon-monoxide dehydrogenase large subunit
MTIGQRRLRVEDHGLLVGAARFVDDIPLAGALEAAFVRSPVAHGTIQGIDASVAASSPGVEAVVTGAELGLGALEPPCTNPDASTPPQPVLAAEKVRYAGEPVAVVLAGSRYEAEDACDQVLAEIDPLEALIDPRRALEPDAPQIHERVPNLAVDTRRDEGDVNGAFEGADLIVERSFSTPRHSALPIEARAVAAVPEASGLTVWSSSQGPHKLRQAISELLGLDPASVRVLTPDVGGGFGLKAHVYPEDVVIAAMALRTGRAVKWVEDRAENLAASSHAREQEIRVRAALTADGELTALEVDMLCDQGAYGAYPHGVTLEALTTSGMLPGPYRVRSYRLRARTAMTNKSPVGAYRGVGFVVSSFVHERLMDVLARESGRDPVELRRRNLIAADEMPYTSVTHHPYDNGDYRRALDAAAELIGYEEAPELRRRSRGSGHRRGIGVACYVEPTGMNSAVFEGRGMVGIAGFDAARVTLEKNGTFRVWTTTPGIGQGSQTTLAQIAAQTLGVGAERVRVEYPDTAAAELAGTGAFASRSAVSAGGAVTDACGILRDRLLEEAADRLEAAPGDLMIGDGRVQVAGSAGASVEIAELLAAHPERYGVSSTFDPPQTVYPYATHACQVAVDEDTGEVTVERYVIAEDCGTIVNPAIVEGQVHGATAQGLGGALYEGHEYDDAGQLRTASLMDYLVPTSTEVPELELIHLELPSPVTESGVKGVGEGGTIGAAPAIANAIADAVGAEFNSFPIAPEEVVNSVDAS